MDDDNGPALRTSLARGGAVEPAHRAGVAKERFQTPLDDPAVRFELRDPFAEVTYRANTFPEIVEKADQLGSSRFAAVDSNGKRMTLEKVDGEWMHAREQSTESDRSATAAPYRDNTAKDPVVEAVPKAPVDAIAPNVKSIARIDAQAERAANVARIEAALMDRYLIKRTPVTVGDVTLGRTEYRFRGDTSRVAFTESTFRLATETNSPSVARSMVDVAEARNWRSIRVSGNEDFKRFVWLEASVRGVKAIGYEPSLGDLEALAKEREATLVNRIEPAKGESLGGGAPPAEKGSARGGGGRKAVLAAIDAILVAKHVPEQKRQAVLAAATEKLAERIRNGQVPRVKIYDKAAAPQRPPVVPRPEAQRTRERTAPVR